jgi:hypothetical protein
MEKDEAARKRKKWGDKPCSHPVLDKEVKRGEETGDLACLTCGLSMLPVDWDNLRYEPTK